MSSILAPSAAFCRERGASTFGSAWRPGSGATTQIRKNRCAKSDDPFRLSIRTIGLINIAAWVAMASTAVSAAITENVAACQACHGAAGISPVEEIPNIAGQKATYLRAQLQAFRAGTRSNVLMNSVARSLTDDSIDALADYWSGVPAAALQVVESPPTAIPAHDEFPKGFPDDFTLYQSTVAEDEATLTRRWASREAMASVREGIVMPEGAAIVQVTHLIKRDASGNISAGDIRGFSTMTWRADAAKHIPEILRNDAWTYGLFEADRRPRPDAHQAQCLACHKPRAEDNYIFTREAMHRPLTEDSVQ